MKVEEGGRPGLPIPVVRRSLWMLSSIELECSQSSEAVCESEGGRSGFPVPIVSRVSVDVKQH